jgi:hypothetical protein
VDLAAILTGIGAIITAAGGTVLVIREFRRRDRVETTKEIDALSHDLHVTRQNLIASQRYAHRLQDQLAVLGVEFPDPPEPHKLIDSEQ